MYDARSCILNTNGQAMTKLLFVNDKKVVFYGGNGCVMGGEGGRVNQL